MRINGVKTAFSAVIWPVWLLDGFFESGDPGRNEFGRHSYNLSGSTDLLQGKKKIIICEIIKTTHMKG